MFRKRLRHQYASIPPQPQPSFTAPLRSRRRLWNVLNLQSEAEVCHSDSLSIVYVPVCSSQIDPVCHVSMSLCLPPSVCCAVCVPVYVAVCVRLVCFDDECVPLLSMLLLSVVASRVVAVCQCKWSTFLSLLCCIAGALAFAYCACPAGHGRKRDKGRETLPSIANRLRIEMENAPNYKSKLTSGPYLCL